MRFFRKRQLKCPKGHTWTTRFSLIAFVWWAGHQSCREDALWVESEFEDG